MKHVHGVESWSLEGDAVELSITKQGGMMAPVRFFPGTDREVQPYFVSPWQDEEHDIAEPVLQTLRGDFFCLPFGENNVYGEETHPVHGETAGSDWTFESHAEDGPVSSLVLSIEPTVRSGRVEKHVSVVSGQSCVYVQHRLEGFVGPMTLGHHATLAGPEEPGGMHISTAPTAFGIVSPRAERYTTDSEYHSLEPGALFDSLERVPTVWKADPFADCTRFPRRYGFVDIVAVAASDRSRPAWTAAVVPSEGFLWFSLRDPAVQPTTVLWMENHGRHGEPWSGRTCCIGLEDVCGFLAGGLAPSTEENELTRRGVPTSIELDPARPTVVNYIQGVALIPHDFERVADVQLDGAGLRFVDQSGKTIEVPVNHEFLSSGTLSA